MDLSTENNPLITSVKKGKFIIPALLAPVVCYILITIGGYCQEYFDIFMTRLNIKILDWWNIVDLFGVGFTTILFFVWVAFVEKRSPMTMGFFPIRHRAKEFLKGLVIGAVLFTFTLVILMFLNIVHFDHFQINGTTLFSCFLVALGYVIQGSAEEIYVRGWLLPVVTAKTNVYIGLAVSSLFFGVIHLGNDGADTLSTLSTVLFALLAGIYAIKKGNIWGVCGIHIAWNFVEGNIYGLSVSGFTSESSLTYFKTSGPLWLSGGEYGIEGSLVTVIVYILVILYFLFFIKQDLDNSSQIQEKN
ncbi:MAG: CPBP family intramembrane metalloprotease [Streptococcus sp.]|nr:CPBP family intramembrane metalloprotease [Streptococcus sp.]